MLNKLLVATTNLGKVKELIKLLSSLNIEVVTLNEFSIKEPEETGETFKDNAELKAKYYGDIAKLPTLADDSGLSIMALNGAPGVKSARWGGDESDYNKIFIKLENAITESSIKSTNAYFTSVISLYLPNTGELVSFEGKIEGNIAFPPAGDNGFGYDPVFVPSGYTKTFAEMSADEKNKISHRTQAMNKFIEYIKCKS